MSFFQRPGESSSDEDSSSEEEDLDVSINDHTHDSAKDSIGTTEEIVGQTLTPTETLSLVDSLGENGTNTTVDEHRNLMLATMLEELSKYKAAELLNNANAGSGRVYDKSSPEVHDMARNLFATSSSMLSGHGLLPAAAVSEEKKLLRQQYMAGLENWSYRNAMDTNQRESGTRGRVGVMAANKALVRRPSQQPSPFLGTTAGQIQQFQWETSQIEVLRRPSAELQLSAPIPIRVGSRYSSQFEEKGMLGRGGFGRVYHTYNLLDRKEYAVKKIPLSPRLSERYQRGGHSELAHILREVQAMATLDHCNVVRYYGTWIEEPTGPAPNLTRPKMSGSAHSFRNRLLLENKPANSTPSFTGGQRFAAASAVDDSVDPFERLESNNDKQLWSYQKPQTPSVSGAGDTNPFSDGQGHHNQPDLHAALDNPSVYVLHVQMSMYPMTLADYILPADSPRKSISNVRHCFHLIPTLRIILAILSGLQYIHAAGFIHRDIKPSNIFLSQLDFASPLAFSDGYADTGTCHSCAFNTPRYLNPRIGDFGLVADLEKSAMDKGVESTSIKGHSSRPIGTEYYRPPQQGQEADGIVDEKVDVFALGVIMLELLCICRTRMERYDLLRVTQRGNLPAGLGHGLTKEQHSEEVIDMTNRLISGMIDPVAKTRWRCGMVKSGIEGILTKVVEHLDSTREVPD